MTELEYWKKRAELAESYIEESPCDPDITVNSWDAYNKWLNFVRDAKVCRPLVDLYEILHHSIRKRNVKKEGICNNINRLMHEGIISPVEHEALLSHFKAQRPTTSLYTAYYSGESYEPFWWPRNANGWEIRKIFVSMIFYKLKNGDHGKAPEKEA